MNKHSLLMICGLLAMTSVYAANEQQLTEETRGAIKALGSELKATLKSAMKNSPLKIVCQWVCVRPLLSVVVVLYSA